MFFFLIFLYFLALKFVKFYKILGWFSVNYATSQAQFDFRLNQLPSRSIEFTELGNVLENTIPLYEHISMRTLELVSWMTNSTEKNLIELCIILDQFFQILQFLTFHVAHVLNFENLKIKFSKIIADSSSWITFCAKIRSTNRLRWGPWNTTESIRRCSARHRRRKTS